MNLQALSDFLAWLDVYLTELGWSDNQLAKKAGISHTVIGKARRHIQVIGWEACFGIARALDLPPEVVLRHAGHLPASPDQDDKADELLYLFQLLTQPRQDDLLDIARMYRQAGQNNSH